MYSMVSIGKQYCIVYFNVAKNVDLKCFHHKNQMVIVLSNKCIDEPYGDSFFTIYKCIESPCHIPTK